MVKIFQFRWVCLAYFAAGFFLVFSGFFNARFAMQMVQTDLDKLVWAIGTIAADILKAFFPVIIWIAVRKSQYFRAAIAVVLLLVTSSYSILAGFHAAAEVHVRYSKNIIASVEEFRGHQRAVKDIKRELASLPRTQPLDALEAVLEAQAGVPFDKWKRTNHCTDATRPVTRSPCQPVLEARQKLDHAKRRHYLKNHLTSAEAKIEHLSSVKSMVTQSEAVSDFVKLFGWSLPAEYVGPFCILLLMAMAEIGSIFGMLIARIQYEQTRENVTKAQKYRRNFGHG